MKPAMMSQKEVAALIEKSVRQFQRIEQTIGLHKARIKTGPRGVMYKRHLVYSILGIPSL